MSIIIVIINIITCVSFPRIIQNYVVREEAGTLASDVMDTNKVSAVVVQYVALSEH